MKIEYAIVLLSVCILVSGYWIGNTLKQDVVKSIEVEEILSLSETAKYLNLSEDSIKKIISQEERFLEESGTFSGMMFPYSKVYNEYVFSKKSLDEWMEENTKSRRVYSKDGIISR